jgi:uncharacterized ferredoxin-like protein
MARTEESFRLIAVERVAEAMALAARTAPKGRGIDLLSIVVLTGDDIQRLAAKMKEIGDREKHQTFLRDSENITSAQAIVLIGTKKKVVGLRYCSFCGYPGCDEADKADAVCALNSVDLGIAVGSAVAVAADHRIDNRVMYSVGKAALEAKLLGSEVVIAFGIPLSVSAKNPFFDRK